MGNQQGWSRLSISHIHDADCKSSGHLQKLIPGLPLIQVEENNESHEFGILAKMLSNFNVSD